MIAFGFDQAKTNASLNKVAALLDLSCAQVVTRHARLWLRDIVRATPPTGRGKLATSPKAQRELGERRISRDIGRWFPMVEQLQAYKDSKEVASSLKGLAKAGNYRAISRKLTEMGIPNQAVVHHPVRSLHKRQQTKRRTFQKEDRIFVTSRGGRADYISDVHKRLGQAKAGWSRAAGPLRVPLPGWAKRHSGKQPGHFRGITDRQRPSIEFANGTPYIQKREHTIMRATGIFRERMMKLELEKLWRFSASDNLASARARIAKGAFEAMAL